MTDADDARDGTPARRDDAPAANRDGAFEQSTRAVFDAHHRVQDSNDATFARLRTLIDPSYYGLPEDHFAGRRVLDAGCGSNANASTRFLELGAEVHSVDLGVDWMDCARRRLEPYGDRSTIASEDVLALTLEDASFHFVHCQGVLHHTRDPEQGFRELARVTRPGGHTYITVMATGDGVLYEWVNVLRARYKVDEAFRAAVDGLTGERLSAGVRWLQEIRAEHEEVPSGEAELFGSLFDDDLVLTIKDRLQAPTYHGFGFTEAELRGWYEEAGYDDVRRISRYVHGLTNLRRFLAPMYLHHEHPLSRMLFGEGYVQLIGSKR